MVGGLTELRNGGLLHLYLSRTAVEVPIPVATRSKAWIWDCGFEFRWKHGCLSLVSAAYCQVEVSATG